MAFNDPDPYTFLNRFSEHLPGSWQFYLCGSGEPFMTPKFLKIVNRLVKMKHQVGVMTNFSASEEKIVEFCKITGNRLFEFSASMHLEYVNLKEFLQKAILVKQLVGDKFSVRSVARKGRLSELEKIGQSFRNKGIRFVLHLERDYIKNSIEEPFVHYSHKERNIIRDFRGRFYDKNILKFKGKSCWAGSKYLVINEEGDAYRCNPAQRFKADKGYLGNLLKGTFKLNKNPSVCRYRYCYCLQPIALGMILNVKDR